MEVYNLGFQIKGLSYEETLLMCPLHTVLLGYVGSISHGTYAPSTDPNSIDDKDILGVCVAPESVYLGLQKFEQREKKYLEWDSVVYELRKFISLLLKNNPNVLGLLWLRQSNYIHISESGQRLIDNRNIFVSKQAYHSFSGYAHGQLHRMEHMAFKGYMGEKRKKLVEQFGYDTKNAAHLIRLLRMGIEFLADGNLQVFREDAAELKDIKQGKWGLEKVKREAESLFALAREANVRSPLPPQPDYHKAEQLLMSIIKEELRLA
jgi:predicted nucleotidyltransferase